MRSLNQVQLIGRLGKEPEVNFTTNGSRVANFNIATNETWKDKSGERHENVEWHRIVLWEKLAEIAEQYLVKGSRVYVAGKLRTRQWKTDKGQQVSTTEIIGNELIMLDAPLQGGE